MKEQILKKLSASKHLLESNTYTEEELEGIEEVAHCLWVKLWRKK